MDIRSITREELSKLFKIGSVRKLGEHEIFVMRAANEPGRADLYADLITYVGMEYRYYDMAYHYYSGDLSFFEDGLNDDLMLLTESSELSPKLYAEYLRELSPETRVYEKITHGYLLSLKHNIATVKEAMT